MAESIKSRFKPAFPRKYKGNVKNIICRSSWERRFCNYCDINESIIEWGSEEFFIPYISPKDNRVHKYYPDFIIKVKESTNKIKTYVIEVKPKKQTEPPKKRKRVPSPTYMNAQPLQLTKQSGKQQKNFVMIEELNLKLSPKKN